MPDRKLRILVAKPGLDGHDRGAKIIARALRDAGVEVIYTGLHQTPEMIVTAAIQEDVDAVGLSVMSGAHMTLFPAVIDLLKRQNANDIGVFGGGIIPDDDIPKLKAMGVAEIFKPRQLDPGHHQVGAREHQAQGLAGGWLARLPAAGGRLRGGAARRAPERAAHAGHPRQGGLIDALIASGEKRIEVTSFVSPKWVPQLADADELLKRIGRREGVTFSALVPNLKGLERARAAGLEEAAVFLSVTETHSEEEHQQVHRRGAGGIRRGRRRRRQVRDASARLPLLRLGLSLRGGGGAVRGRGRLPEAGRQRHLPALAG